MPVWFIDSDEDRAVSKDIEDDNLPDRVIGIIASAFLEDRLTVRILSHLHDDTELTGKLFKGTGPIASFSAKVDLGCLMGLYGEQTRCDMHLVRKIRNEFAHRAAPSDFESAAIRSLCDRFTMIGRISNDGWLFGAPNPFAAFLLSSTPVPVPTTTRGTFVATVKLLLGAVSMVVGSKPRVAEF